MSKLPFEKLLVWQKAMNFTEDIYSLTRTFPENEKFGLISQLRRAAVSVPSNIAEGSQRGTDKDFRNFVLLSKGSLAEISSQLILSQRLGFLSEQECKKLLDQASELQKMLYAFASKLLSIR